MEFDRSDTALVVIDPQDDVLSETGVSVSVLDFAGEPPAPAACWRASDRAAEPSHLPPTLPHPDPDGRRGGRVKRRDRVIWVEAASVAAEGSEMRPEAEKCRRCGGTRIAPGKLRDTNSLINRVVFLPDDAPFWTLSSPHVAITARLCMDCGTV